MVARASRADELILRGTLVDDRDRGFGRGRARTAVIVVGRVLTASQFPDSHLYSVARCRDECRTLLVIWAAPGEARGLAAAVVELVAGGSSVRSRGG